MNNMWIAILLAVGAGTWVFSKVIRRTGGNMKTSITSSVFCGAIVLLVAWTLLNMINPS